MTKIEEIQRKKYTLDWDSAYVWFEDFKAEEMMEEISIEFSEWILHQGYAYGSNGEWMGSNGSISSGELFEIFNNSENK